MFYVQSHKYIFGNTTMRITEIADAQAQLELWKLVNDSVWTAIQTQAQPLVSQRFTMKAR